MLIYTEDQALRQSYQTHAIMLHHLLLMHPFHPGPSFILHSITKDGPPRLERI